MGEFVEILDDRDLPIFIRKSEIVAVREMQNSFKENGFSVIVFLKSGLELRSKTGQQQLMARLNDEGETA